MLINGFNAKDRVHKMVIATRQAAQGDVMFQRVQSIPPEAKQQASVKDRHVVALSETHHDHFVDAGSSKYYTIPSDTLTCYLRVDGPYADVIHARSFDTHETIRLEKGDWMIRRQREHTPEGWRRVED